MTQLGPNLLDLLTEVPDWVHLEEPPSLEQRWWQWHLAHPEVGARLLRMAREWRDLGNGRWSVKAMADVARWQDRRLAEADRIPHVNNSWTAFYARWLMEVDPQLDGMFELRTQRSAA